MTDTGYEGVECGTLYGTNLFRSHDGHTYDMGHVSDELVMEVVRQLIAERDIHKEFGTRWLEIARVLKQERDDARQSKFPDPDPRPVES